MNWDELCEHPFWTPILMKEKGEEEEEEGEEEEEEEGEGRDQEEIHSCAGVIKAKLRWVEIFIFIYQLLQNSTNMFFQSFYSF